MGTVAEKAAKEVVRLELRNLMVPPGYEAPWLTQIQNVIEAAIAESTKAQQVRIDTLELALHNARVKLIRDGCGVFHPRIVEIDAALARPKKRSRRRSSKKEIET